MAPVAGAASLFGSATVSGGEPENKSQLGLDHYEHRSWTAWHRHTRLVFLAQLFLLRLQRKFKKTPALTLPQARLLIEGCFPEPKRQPGYVLILLAYHTRRRNYQAYKSHRKRRMKELKKWKSLKMSL
jgi:hypothetical protein